MDHSRDNLANITERIFNGQETARAICDQAVTNAQTLNESLNFFLEINHSAALKRAEEIDRLAGFLRDARGRSRSWRLQLVPTAAGLALLLLAVLLLRPS